VKGSPVAAQRGDNRPPLKWFSERLKRVTSEFTDLIEQQESTMCPCQLARSHAGTSADEPRNRDVVMRCP